jgi:hypothetical protein
VYLLTFFLLCGAILWTLHAADNPLAFPAEIGVRVRTVQLDKEKVQGQINVIQLQLQSEFNRQTEGLQKTINNDSHELDLLKEEAFKTTGRSKDEFDADMDKLTFTAKPPKPEKK